jgi:glycerophosphoryl diester phosphodiesterase
MAYIRTSVDPEMQDIYNKLHELGVMTMTSITATSDKVKNNTDRRTAYHRELLAEPDIIETDYPSEFIGLPLDRKTIHAQQDAAVKARKVSVKTKK